MRYKRTIAFDLDDVICSRTSDEGGVSKYHTCYPFPKMISIVNESYDQGNKIIIYTARGMSTFCGNVQKIYSELYEITKTQLREWGVKHHELIMGKPHYDIIIDDKALNSERVSTVKDISKFFNGEEND
tara:strand:+ start:91 stop:477 length:387 start_codon:yes stop_codon:yes gene_type:complete